MALPHNCSLDKNAPAGAWAQMRPGAGHDACAQMRPGYVRILVRGKGQAFSRISRVVAVAVAVKVDRQA